MTHPMSVRFRDATIAVRLRDEAEASDRSLSALAEEILDEGLRMRKHPLVAFRPGASGRRAALRGGPDVSEVVGGILGGDVPPSERVGRAVHLFGLTRAEVDAVLSYYADFTDEIDAEIAANLTAADEAEAEWRRRQDLLAR